MVENIRTVLEELGYNHVMESVKEFRMRPLYRESSNDTSLCVFKSGNWKDFSLGIGGNLADLIKLHSGDEAAKWLSDKHLDIDILFNDEPRQKISIPKTFDKDMLMGIIPDFSYWEGRGIGKEVISRFQGGVVRSGRMINRYVFPIFNGKNDIVGFSGRDLCNNNTARAKWKNIGGVSQWVYPAFINKTTLQKSKNVILVESIGDMLSLFNAGIENVLVTFGVVIHPGIINFLLKIDTQCVIVALNNDKEDKNKNSQVGNLAADKMKLKLSQYFDPNQIEISLPDKKDFGNMSIEEIKLWKTKRLCQPVA